MNRWWITLVSLLFIAPALFSPVTPAEQTPAASAQSLPVRPKPPVILAVDGIDLKAYAEWPRTSDYLKTSLDESSNLKALGVKPGSIESVSWSGEIKEIGETIARAKTAIRALAQRARDEQRAFVIVAHSWGTILAYRALRELEGQHPTYGETHLLITLGSPLGEGSSFWLTPSWWAGLAIKNENVEKPATVKVWTNYWSDGDKISGFIRAASNVQVPSSDPVALLANHSAYYKPPLVEIVGAEIVIAAAKAQRVPPVQSVSSGPGATLKSLAGKWQGATATGEPFTWTITTDGRYESVYRQWPTTMRRRGTIAIAPDGAISWREDGGRLSGKLVLSRDNSSGAQVFRGTINGRSETFEARQIEGKFPPAAQTTGSVSNATPSETPSGETTVRAGLPTVDVRIEDGSVIRGTVSGGGITLKTGFGEVKIEGPRIRAFTGAEMSLDDGSTLKGTISGGELQVTSAHGVITITGNKIRAIGPAPLAAGGPMSSDREVGAPRSQRAVGTNEFPKPEFYGAYVVLGRRLVKLPESVPSTVTVRSNRTIGGLPDPFSGIKLAIQDISALVRINDPQAFVAVYHNRAKEFASRATIVKYKPSPQHGAGVFIEDTQVSVQIKPAENIPDLFYVLPTEGLSPGVYSIVPGRLLLEDLIWSFRNGG